MIMLQALVHARDLTPTQAPVILWAFAVLRYSPVMAVLSALDRQIEKQASQMTAQVSPPVQSLIPPMPQHWNPACQSSKMCIALLNTSPAPSKDEAEQGGVKQLFTSSRVSCISRACPRYLKFQWLTYRVCACRESLWSVQLPGLAVSPRGRQPARSCAKHAPAAGVLQEQRAGHSHRGLLCPGVPPRQ